MKPSLTPKDVKDYIRDGARVSRQDPATGVESARAPVNGAPGELYELDAYGSLRKLSREHAGTPVCGVEVVGGNSDKIEIRRATTETIDLGSAYYAYAGQLVSVAQGGRRFATMIPHRYVDAAGTWTFRLQQGQWSVDTVEGPSMILYTEQDTAYVSQSWRPAADTTLSPSQLDLHVRIGSEQPGRRVAQTTVTSFLPLSSGSGWLSWGAGVVSPTGDWVVFDFYKYETDNCTGTVGDQYINSIYAVPMRGSTTPQTVSSTSWQTNCQGGDYPDGWDDGGIAAAWRDDGTEFLTARRIKHATSWEVDLRRVGVGTSSVTPSSFPTHTGAEQAYTLKWAPEGGRVRFGYAQGGTWNCMTEVRQASALGTLIGSPEPCVPTSPSAQAPSQLLASLQILKPRFNNGFYHWTDPLVRRARMAQLAARRQQALRPISNR